VANPFHLANLNRKKGGRKEVGGARPADLKFLLVKRRHVNKKMPDLEYTFAKGMKNLGGKGLLLGGRLQEQNRAAPLGDRFPCGESRKRGKDRRECLVLG